MQALHVLYKTTNVLTGKFYVGIHSTENLDDGYMGSGLMLKSSLQKYGKRNHRREILEILPTRQMLIEREAEVVTDDLLADPMCMNLIKGGSTTKLPGSNAERNKKISQAKRASGYRHSDEARKNISLARAGKKISAEGKVKRDAAMASDAVRKKIGESQIGNQKASKQVSIHGTIYPSQGAAMAQLNMSYKPFKRMMQSDASCHFVKG